MIRRPRCVAFVRWTGDCVSKVPEISGPYVHLTAQATRRLLAVRSATLGATGGAVMAKGRGSADAHDLTAVRPSWTARRTRARDDRPADAGPVRTAVRPPRWQGVIPIQRGTQESRRAAFSPSSSINGRVRLTCAPRSRSTGADRGPACGVVNSPERRDGSMIGRAKAWEAAPPRQTFVPHFPYCSAKSFATCERIDPLICRAEDQILLVHELGS